MSVRFDVFIPGTLIWTGRDETIRWCSRKSVRTVNPFQAKKKTTQRAESWQSVANSFKKNHAGGPNFKETTYVGEAVAA